MIPFYLGKDKQDHTRIYIEPDCFQTHLHLVGATGAGKTSAIHTILRPIMMEPREQAALFVIDPMGNLSMDLLRFIANERYCPGHVRERLVYIQPSREDAVIPFNPLAHTSESNRYYQAMRAVDIVLRAWAAQDVASQPRLLQWTYKAFAAAASMGLPIAMCRYLIHPGTEEHKKILQLMPGDIASHWHQIIDARGSEATRILESCRNRLDPFFESVSLRRMFGSGQSRFDCERMIRERRIVILNLAKYGSIPGFIGHTIGSLVLNEIFETANRLATTEGKSAVEPTYILMDEFQHFVTVDIADALPTVRQMGLRLLLAHQSFSQLEREDIDLTQMIWQARSRLVFANNAQDADILADELAKLTFDPQTVKHALNSKRQLIIGYRKEWLESVSTTRSQSSTESEQNSVGYHHMEASERRVGSDDMPSKKSGKSDQNSKARGKSSGSSAAESKGQSQANVPIHETFTELSSVTFESFEEFSIKWGQRIRRLRTGEAFALFANDPTVREVAVEYFPMEDTPQSRDAVSALLETNFSSDFFISSAQADEEADRLRHSLLQGTIRINPLPGTQNRPLLPAPREDEPDEDRFFR